jgi:2-C-methyl-D-erythritol 4-phosphate cytidylyltransferase
VPATEFSVARCWAVVPAAGIGNRMGAGIPKQYLVAAGRTLIEHSLQALLDCPRIEGICVALHKQDTHAATLPVFSEDRVYTTEGAAERAGSVLAGLHALPDKASADDWVLVHDAARPCLQAADIDTLIDTVIRSNEGALLAEPVVDTVKEADDNGVVAGTLDRSRLWRAQTPQIFRLHELKAALEQAEETGAVVTDEASAMELAGYTVRLVQGSASNIKVTVAADLPLAEFYLQQQAAAQ